MPAGGDSRPQQVPPIPPRPSRNICPTLAMCSTGSTSCAGSPKASPWYDERYNTVPLIRGPQHTNRTCSEPASLSCAGPTTSPTPTRRTSTGCSTLTHVSEPPGTRSKSSTRSTKPTTSIRPTRRSDGSPTSTPPARHREYHQVVDTIIAWGSTDPGLPQQQTGIQRTHRRDQQPPPGPTPRCSRVHQLRQLRSQRNSRNMTPTPTTAPKTHEIAQPHQIRPRRSRPSLRLPPLESPRFFEAAARRQSLPRAAGRVASRRAGARAVTASPAS